MLKENALPSIINQTVQPTAVVIVSDRRSLNKDEVLCFNTTIGKEIPLYTITNSNKAGVAGSWNTGIDFISKKYPESYIAIIDDDDQWHTNHLSTCISHSANGTADVVLSGINVITNKKKVKANIPLNISINDFLVGNPGWQGSNTFIKANLAIKIGGFTNGQISGNDRDFAIRVLESEAVKITYTTEATVDWRCNQSPEALSAPGSKQKLKGYAQFLKLHGHKMSSKERSSFFARSEQLFSISKQDILKELELLTSANE
ncbi:glycosyltransferase family 2 protein [Thiomicrorhabdus xiamenensis]|nr:glycosyltransferase family 2 protein [Thiomicrorhabdus xiamenensis]